MWYAIGAVLIAVGGGAAYAGTRSGGLKSEMDRLQPTSIATVPAGSQVEVNGRVSCETPVLAPHANVECVHYSYKVERRERQRRTGSSSGPRYRWVTIDSGAASVPFVLTDSSGSIDVDPEGATFDAPIVAKGPVRTGGGVATTGGVMGMLGNLTAFATPQRVTAHAIVLHQQVYVLGGAEYGPSGKPAISKGEGSFYISTRSEQEISKSLAMRTIGFYIAGAIFAVAGVVLLGMAAMGRL